MKPALIILLTLATLMVGMVMLSLAADSIPAVKAPAEVKTAPAKAAPAADSSEALIGPRTLVVYYFHGTQRCSNCLKIESYTKEAVDSAYAGQLKDSLMVWRVINTDEDANKHYRDDYQLYTKSVILCDVQGGKEVRWKNLDKVWDYLGDKAAFKSYICDEIAAFMKAR